MTKMTSLIILICLIETLLSKCTMKQDCDITKPDCSPSPANFTDPVVLKSTPNIICPEYIDQKACCDEGQNILLRNNFESLDSIFGTKYGGCDVCAINLKRFWCDFTCSPDQDKFLKITGYKNFTIENVNYTLLMIDMDLNRKMNCDLFNSCKKTKYASQVVAMSNAIGFTTFQGTEAYRKAPIFINLSYVQEGGLDFPVDTCETQPVDGLIRGFHVDDTCKCNSCDKACHYTNDTTLPVLEGFSLITVGMFYLFVALFTAIIFICKCYYRKTNSNDHSRSSSIDSTRLVSGLDSNSSNRSHSNSNITNDNINNNLAKTNKD